jgi:ActR/RegA family two-component response regulator/cytidylate kinase
MAVVTIFSASHCHEDEVALAVADHLSYRLLSSEELIAQAASRFDVADKTLSGAMHGSLSFLNRLTREKERSVTYLRSTLAELIADDRLVYHGFAGHLLPDSLSHVLRVALVAKHDYRVSVAQNIGGLSRREAEKVISAEDKARKQWTLYLHNRSPFDKSLYDLFIPVDEVSVDQVVAEICQYCDKLSEAYGDSARRAVADFQLECRVERTLVEQGQDVEVSCKDGIVTVVINKYVMWLEHRRKELEKIVLSVEGVDKVVTRVGPNYRPPKRYANLELPQKLLLVDDEEEFVHTLSERLQTRNLEPVVAHDGEAALSIVENDAPEVMVLDLKMPGIDGLEVLRRVKGEHPDTEVIILTGYGSEANKAAAEKLGAFAILDKPVDINVLAQTMKSAYAKLAKKRQADEEEATPGGQAPD